MRRGRAVRGLRSPPKMGR